MIKKLISLALASVSTLALAGCGATDNPVMDKSVMGKGESNQTGLGGYWWTYVDRSGKSSVTPDTGKIDPLDTTTKPAKLKPGLAVGEGKGLEDGAFHVKGTVAVAPAYNDPDPNVIDKYWDGFYGPNGADAPNVCGPTGCMEMKYPSVGMGFGFKAKNAPLGADAADKVGVSFKMKVGDAHAAIIATAPINVSLPMDLTDVPDPTFSDQFGTDFANIEPTGNAAAGKNTPICTFPGTITGTDAAGAPTLQGSGSKTCFANMTTDKHADLAPTTTWTTYCLHWTAFGAPSWGGGLASATPIPVTDVDSLKSHIIKMQFDAFKPPETATAPVDFDFYVDDVILLDQAKWDSVCTDGAKIFPSAT